MKMKMKTELWLNRLTGSAGKTEITGEHSGVHYEMEIQDPSCYRPGRRQLREEGVARGLRWLMGL